MPARNQFPKDIVSLIRDPQAFNRAMTLLQSLERTEIITSEGERIPLRASDNNAIFDLRTERQGAIPQEPTNFLHWETIIWRDRALALFGSFGENSVARADALIRAINGKAYNDKILWMLPFLGGDRVTCCVPLRDFMNAGATGISGGGGVCNETNGFSQSAEGLRISTNFKASDVFTTRGSIGLGYWERSFTNNSPNIAFGSYNTDGNARVALQLFTTGITFYGVLGVPGSYNYLSATTTPNSHHYAQANVGDLFIFQNGIGVANGANATGAPAFTENGLEIHTDDFGFTYNGRCAVAYVTSGDMTIAEVADFHSLLGTYLITPTGR